MCTENNNEQRHEISNNVVCATTCSIGSDQPAHTRSLIRAFASRMNILRLKLLTEHHLGFLSLEGGYTDSSESTFVEISHCWLSHVAAHFISKTDECRTFRPRIFQARTSRPGHFGHGRLGHGKCQRWTFRPNHKFWVGVCACINV